MVDLWIEGIERRGSNTPGIELEATTSSVCKEESAG
jgi:hypothetical protein